MRSRYAAYVLDNTSYIQETWHTSTRPSPDKINLADENIIWVRLEVLSTKKGGASDAKGIVEFKAYYAKNGEDHVLHEASRFLKNNGRWFYLDGAIKSVGKIIAQSNEGKNAPCPCGSGKKYKRCCGAEK